MVVVPWSMEVVGFEQKNNRTGFGTEKKLVEKYESFKLEQTSKVKNAHGTILILFLSESTSLV